MQEILSNGNNKLQLHIFGILIINNFKIYWICYGWDELLLLNQSV
jgi:hypothetical protein